LKFFQRTLIGNFPAGFDFEISNAIVIAIEKPIRIDWTLIENGLNDFTFVYDDAPGAEAPPLWRPRLRWRWITGTGYVTIACAPAPSGAGMAPVAPCDC
jgi:hypothetical protein